MLGERRNHLGEARNEVFLALHLLFLANLQPFSWSKCLFLLPYLAFLLIYPVDRKWMVGGWILGLGLIYFRDLGGIFIPKNTYLETLNVKLFDLNGWINDKLRRIHGEELGEFIGDMVFGGRGKIHSDFRKLGAVHLISVSGLHISILIGFLRRFMRRRWMIFSIVFLYWYSLGFTIPCLRPLLMMFMAKENPYRRWARSVVLAPLFNLHILSKVSFLLSFMFPLIFAVNGERVRGKFPRLVANFWGAFLYSSLVMCPLTGRLNPLGPVNILIFSPWISALFLYLLLSWPFSLLSPLGEFLRRITVGFAGSLELNGSSMDVGFWKVEASLIILWAISLIFLLGELKNVNFPLFRGSGASGQEGQKVQEGASQPSFGQESQPR